MHFLTIAIILCAGLFGPAAVLRAQPADHPQMMLPMPDFILPGPSRWAVGITAGYTLAMHDAFPASEGEFGSGTGHGFNAGIGITHRFGPYNRLFLLGHMMFERRPGSFEKTIGRYDAADAEGSPISTTVTERADLRCDMIAADILCGVKLEIGRFGHHELNLVVGLGPSLGHVMNASFVRRITVPEPYHLPARPEARYEDAGRTLVVDGAPDGRRRFQVGAALGVGLEAWSPWSGQAISVGIMLDYALTGASTDNDWRAHAVRVNIGWSLDLRVRHDDNGSQPL